MTISIWAQKKNRKREIPFAGTVKASRGDVVIRISFGDDAEGRYAADKMADFIERKEVRLRI